MFLAVLFGTFLAIYPEEMLRKKKNLGLLIIKIIFFLYFIMFYL